MTRYEEALEQQALLRDQLSRPLYRDYIGAFVHDLAPGPVSRSTLGIPRGVPMGVTAPDVGIKPPKEDPEAGNKLANAETHRLTAADSYFCTKEMLPLVKWAAQQLPVNEKWHHDTWPSDFGFIWFEDPYVTIDLRGTEMHFRAMSWGRYSAPIPEGRRQAATLVMLYVDGDIMHDLGGEWHDQNAREKLGKLQLAHIIICADGDEVGPEGYDTASMLGEYKTNGAKLTDEQINALADNQPTLSNDDRFIMAFLMLLDQTVTAKDEFTNRRIARRMRRMNLPERVTVVRLRRVEHMNKYEGESNVAWMHRWVVKGHWRSQPYKDDNGEIYHQRIWIAPYVKGPADKPLRISRKIYALER